jgi:soluble lytic murein transglycosylase-like protein
MISFMTVFTNQTAKKEINLVLKGQRPYKLEVHRTGSLDTYDTYPIFRQSERERSFSPIIFAAANRYSVDPALVKAVIMAESGYDPMAISKKGATGLMQLMPTTAAALGVEDSLNPEHNINGGVKYLKQLLNRFEGDLELALAAYNAGSKKVKKYKGIPPYKATQSFVAKVFHYYQQYKKEI